MKKNQIRYKPIKMVIPKDLPAVGNAEKEEDDDDDEEEKEETLHPAKYWQKTRASPYWAMRHTVCGLTLLHSFSF